MCGEEELPHLCAVLNELDDTAGGVVDGVAPTDIQFLRIADDDESKATNSISGLGRTNTKWPMYRAGLKLGPQVTILHAS